MSDECKSCGIEWTKHKGMMTICAENAELKDEKSVLMNRGTVIYADGLEERIEELIEELEHEKNVMLGDAEIVLARENAELKKENAELKKKLNADIMVGER